MMQMVQRKRYPAGAGCIAIFGCWRVSRGGVPAGLQHGAHRIAPLEVFWTLLGKGRSTAQLVLIEFRLPRLCPWRHGRLGMGISGVIMQDLLL